MTGTENIDVKDFKNVTLCVYIFFALAMAMQFHVLTIIPGSAIALCILGFAYMKRKEMAGTLFESHYHWMIRTFWIGGAVYLPILTIAVSVYIPVNASWDSVMAAYSEGERSRLYLTQLYFESNADLLYRAGMALLLTFSLWWWWRCAVGMFYLFGNNPVKRVTSWI